ncbi:transposase domain-containing protein [Asticcacaulis sp. YBE204]|uniref:transposase domain-containing protein n=1 Tax=Asticcacaulis sp. YBE204 TaxID=1282363 RepID=UPI0003C3D9EC|nr:transposase domain-containing protein [Asticcacaulis sp. YBE204]ESQ78480.1 hypothetical protein AEYBE204_13070 [Asticcacaulis sp. YBE204]
MAYCGETGVSQKIWYGPSELAALALPGLPVERSRMAHYARESGWGDRHDAAGNPLSRARAGRGGGVEYHVSLLPISTRLELIARGLLGADYAPVSEPLETPKAANDQDSGWGWFDAQTQKVKDEAARRLKVIQAVEQLLEAGLKKDAAVARVAQATTFIKASKASIYNWFTLINGVKPADRLPAIAARRKGGGAQVDIDPAAFKFFCSWVLRNAKSGFAEAYRETVDYASENGLPELPPIKTVVRRYEKEVPVEVRIAKRDGMAEAMKSLPPQKRTVAGMSAMELIVVDGHKWDVMVRFPAANGLPEWVGRPTSVVLQDAYSRRIMACRTGRSETSELTQMAFADLLELHGIPAAVLMDNGRAFASKMISGGVKNRYRGKVLPTDPCGLLTSLGIRIHWATPGHGQAKPIERAFRDLEEKVGRHPICEGAYTGNHIDRKPENWGKAVVDLEVFEELLVAQIAKHNAQTGRTAEMSRKNGGQSFDAVFAASIDAGAVVGKATPEQLAMALLVAEQVKADKNNGAVELFGNRFWSDDLIAHKGERLTLRFDPDDVLKDIRVYTQAGQFIAKVPVIAAVGFLDREGAQRQARLVSDHRKKLKAMIAAMELLSAHELANMAPIKTPEKAPKREPKVIRPVRHRHTSVAVQLVEVAPANDAPEHDYEALFAAAVERATETGRPNFQVFEGGLSSSD